MTAPEDPFTKRPEAGPVAGYGPAPTYGPPGYGPPPPGSRASAYGPPQGQGQPGWGPPPGAVQETSSKAIVALVLSICSFCVFPFVPAVVALFLSPGARREIAASRGRLGGDGLVRAAVIVAWINIAVCAVLAVAVVGLIAVAVGAGSS